MAQAGHKLQDLAATSNGIYIFELSAAAASVSRFRGRVWGRRVILFVGNEAARAALTKGISWNKAALMLACSLWAMAAQCDIAIWAERFPTQVNPADLPPRDRQLVYNGA